MIEEKAANTGRKSVLIIASPESAGDLERENNPNIHQETIFCFYPQTSNLKGCSPLLAYLLYSQNNNKLYILWCKLILPSLMSHTITLGGCGLTDMYLLVANTKLMLCLMLLSCLKIVWFYMKKIIK